MTRVTAEATGLRLARIDSRDNLILCETIMFDGGWKAVDTILRRAAISGGVEIGGVIGNHFVDVLDVKEDLIDTVALDKNSYAALKNKWLRCKVEKAL